MKAESSPILNALAEIGSKHVGGEKQLMVYKIGELNPDTHDSEKSEITPNDKSPVVLVNTKPLISPELPYRL